MGITISKQMFEGGNPVLGALTGAMGGLSQGIMNAERIKSMRAGTESEKKRLKLYEDRYADEQKTKAGVQKTLSGLAQLQALMAGGQQQQPQQSYGPAAQGGAFPQAPHEDYGPSQQDPTMEQHARWAEGVQKIAQDPELQWTPDALHAFLTLTHQRESKRITSEHAQRLQAEIQTRIDKGVYQNEMAPDLQVNAQANLEKLKALTGDPQADAAMIDKVRSEDTEGRKGAATSGLLFRQHQRMLSTYGAQLEQRAQAGAPTDEAEALYNQYSNDLLDDEHMAKLWPDAINGTLGMKQELQQTQQQLSQEKMKGVMLDNFLKTPEGLQLQARLEAEIGQAGNAGRSQLETQRQGNRLDLEAQRQQNRLQLPRPGGRGPLATEKDLSEIIHNRFPLGVGENPGDIPNLEAQLRAKIGEMPLPNVNGGTVGADSVERLMAEIKAGAVKDGTEVEKRAAALGISLDELEKRLSGGK